LVERAAHNGLVVGSNPTRPIFYFIKQFKLP
jgi:hypothetical protein